MTRLTLFNSPLLLGYEKFESTLDRIYLHRGIAARQFQRNSVIADGISVIDAELDNGLLHIGLNRPSPDSDIKIIEIKSHYGTENN